MNNGILKKCALLPVGAIATAVGLATLSNVYASAIGLPGVRVATMVIVSLVWLAAIIKMTVHFKTFKADYILLVPSSLYATFSMLTMLIGAFIFDYLPVVGQVIWLIGVVLHTLHLLIFTYRFVIKGIKLETFLPTWFVTYMGYLVSIVSGTGIGFDSLLQGIMIYGAIVYPIIFISMLVRLFKRPLPSILKPTGAIFLAPCSLFFVSYLNVAQQPIDAIVIGAYAVVFITIIRVATLLLSYLRGPFMPIQASLTFPTAIALVATFRMVGYLNDTGREVIATALHHFFGLQLYFTTAIIVYVGYKFLSMLLDSYKKVQKVEPANFDIAKLDADFGDELTEVTYEKGGSQ